MPPAAELAVREAAAAKAQARLDTVAKKNSAEIGRLQREWDAAADATTAAQAALKQAQAAARGLLSASNGDLLPAEVEAGLPVGVRAALNELRGYDARQAESSAAHARAVGLRKLADKAGKQADGFAEGCRRGVAEDLFGPGQSLVLQGEGDQKVAAARLRELQAVAKAADEEAQKAEGEAAALNPAAGA